MKRRGAEQQHAAQGLDVRSRLICRQKVSVLLAVFFCLLACLLLACYLCSAWTCIMPGVSEPWALRCMLILNTRHRVPSCAPMRPQTLHTVYLPHPPHVTLVRPWCV
jgi:hypothetical protein